MLHSRVLALGAALLAATGNAADVATDRAADRLSAVLQAHNYTVQRGEHRVFNTSACAAQGFCWFMNPDSPYAYVTVPPAPGQKASFAGDPDVEYGVLGAKAAWRLRADEAVVVIGRTPPRARYWGATGYVAYKRVRSWLGLGRAKTWRNVFGSIGDSASAVRVAERVGRGDGYGELVAIVLTGSKSTAAEVRRALSSSSSGVGGELLAAGRVLTLAIPAADPRLALQTCLGADCDLYALVLRTAYPEDPSAFAAYTASEPMRVWRVTPPAETKKELFERAQLAPRVPSGASHETDVRAELTPEFKRKYAQLPALVTRAARQAGLRSSRFAPRLGFTPLRTLGVDYGGDCYRRELPCFGDNRDCLYTAPLALPLLGDDMESLLTVGVNHNRTGIAAYTSVTIYNARGQVGLVAAEDTAFANSAAPWLRGTPLEPDADMFYVVRWARNCSVALPAPLEPVFCVQVPTAGYPALGRRDRALFIERSYVSSATGVAPAPGTALPPTVIAVY